MNVRQLLLYMKHKNLDPKVRHVNVGGKLVPAKINKNADSTNDAAFTENTPDVLELVATSEVVEYTETSQSVSLEESNEVESLETVEELVSDEANEITQEEVVLSVDVAQPKIATKKKKTSKNK